MSAITAVTARTSVPSVVTNVFDWQKHHVAMPEPLPIPPTSVVTEIESEADKSDEYASPAAVGDPFAGLTDRAAAPAANDDTDEDDGVEPSSDVDAGRDTRRGDANRKLRRIVGPRLVRARTLSGYSQSEAAAALGYSSPAQVNQWETSRRLVPIFEAIAAARLYGVSIDYLLGETHEPDRDPSAGARHAVLRGVRGMLERVAQITADEIKRHQRLIGPHAGNVRALLESGDALLEAFGAFVRHNHGAFSNMRCGASLQRLAGEFEATLADARTAIRLHDARDADLARALAALGDTDPLPLDDDEA